MTTQERYESLSLSELEQERDALLIRVDQHLTEGREGFARIASSKLDRVEKLIEAKVSVALVASVNAEHAIESRYLNAAVGSTDAYNLMRARLYMASHPSVSLADAIRVVESR